MTSSTAVAAPAALKLTGITAGYGRTTVMRDVSLTVAKGSVTALLGPNGAGKTTLLKTVSGLLTPASGTVEVDGVDVTRLTPHQRTVHGLCHIPEGRGIFRRLTVRENLVMQANPGEEEAAIERAAATFPVLGARLNQDAGTLSGGEQQMLSVARVYVRQPSLILVDEVSLGLAPRLVEEIFAFLAELTSTRDVTLVIVDQFVHRALDLADSAHVMRHGELAFSGTAAELRSRDLFQEYLGQ